MNARRSRFHRIYRRITRRTPNRRAQMQEVMLLRSGQGAGHSVGGQRSDARARRPIEPEADQHPAWSPPTPDLSVFDALPEEGAAAGGSNRSGAGVREGGGFAAVAALSASLFLLACAYAAFAGYTHSFDDGFAAIGLLGAATSLLCASFALYLAGSSLRRSYCFSFLSTCAMTLAVLYGALLLIASCR